MTEEKEKTVTEQLADKITSWADPYINKDSWEINPMLSYAGPGVYEGEAGLETEEDTFTTGFEVTSRQYNLKDFLRLLENVSILHDGKEYTLRDGVQINNLTLRSPRKGAANVDLKDLDDYMKDLHIYLQISYVELEVWRKEDTEKKVKKYPDLDTVWDGATDYATAVNAQDGKVTGVIMDGRDRTDEPHNIFYLQNLYDYLDQQFAPLIHDEGAEHLDGIVITTCSPWDPESDDEDDEDDKDKKSRAVYDNAHNVVIVETGTFFLNDEENDEIRHELGDYEDDYGL